MDVTLTTGNDRFVAGSSRYSVVDSAGSDTIIGGSGVTSIDFSAMQSGVQVDLASTAAQTAGLGILTLQNVRGVIGTAFADTITGSSGDDYIDGRGGADVINTGAGDDRIAFRGTTRGAVVHAGSGNDTITGNGIVFGLYDSVLHGDEGNDSFTISTYGSSSYYGDDGNDLFIIGHDSQNIGPPAHGIGNIIDGGAGDDVFRGDSFGVVEGGDGYDVLDLTTFNLSTVYLGSTAAPGSYDLQASGIEETRVKVSTSTGFGGAQAQPLFVYGGVGNDLIIGSGSIGITFDGGGGNDRITGTSGNDAITTGPGNDRIATDLGTDTIVLGGGNDIVDGGAGEDTLVVRGNAATYQTILAGDKYLLVGIGQQAAVTGVEQVRFADGTVSWSSLTAQATAFDGLRYIASNADLLTGYGADAQAGLNHFLSAGLQEARSVQGFDPLRYVASNPDLARGYGTDVVGAETHYIQHGYAEGRSTTAFDALRYVASNPDLVSSIGTNIVAAETHYIQQGLTEGRSTMSFDPLRYLASNKDLALGFGANTTAAETHYIEHGLAEGRSATSFDALQYLAANTDLASGFGYDVQGAERHYVEHGLAEGRATTGFDAIAYLLTYPDLAMAKLGPTWATEHWVLNGADEGRIGDGLFGREQTSHADTIGTVVNDALQTTGDHDWFALTLTAGQHVSVAMHGAGLAPGLSLADEFGNRVAAAVGSGDDATIDFTADHAATYYVTAYSNAGVTGAYMIDSHFI